MKYADIVCRIIRIWLFAMSICKKNNAILVRAPSILSASVLAVLFFSSIASAQDTVWVRRYNGPDNDYDLSESIGLDNAGNVFVSGYSSSTASGEDFIAIKYNSAGVEQWVRLHNGTANSDDRVNAMAVDPAGNCYVTGSSNETGAYTNYLTIKYNSGGTEQWTAQYNGTAGMYDNPYAIAVDNAGSIYVTGESRGVGTFHDLATVKYNSAGAERWVARYSGAGNSGDCAYAIAVDNDHCVYITGSSDETGVDDDIITIKYDSSGAEQWVRHYNGPGNDYDCARCVVVDNGTNGNVYVTGSSEDSITGYDYVVVKYNSAGVEQWVKRYNGSANGSDTPYSLKLDGSGNVYVTGSSTENGTYLDYATIKYNSAGVEQWVELYNGTGNGSDAAYAIEVDNDANIYVTGTSPGMTTTYDFVTIKYDSASNVQWTAVYNGPTSSGDVANAIAVDDAGYVYVTGESWSTAMSDIATIKYTQSGEICELSAGMPETGFLRNHPDPFLRKTKIEFDMPGKGAGTVAKSRVMSSLKVFDITGRLVKDFDINNADTGGHVIWDGRDNAGHEVPAGIYICVFGSNNGTITDKLHKL